MRTAGGTYSRLIKLAQTLLPLTALAILATLFLLARAPTEEGEIRFADVEAIARENRLTKPSYSGVTPGGESVTASARAAMPNGQGGTAERLTARIETQTGQTLDFNAGFSAFEPEAGKVRFSELVRVDASTGYQMETSALTLTPDTGYAVSDGDVEIHAPFGLIEAGRMEVLPGDTDRGQRLLFSDGVHLLYTPRPLAP